MASVLLLCTLLAPLLASCEPKIDTVVLQPLGRMSASDIAMAKDGIEAMFNTRVVVRAPQPLPKKAYYAPRRRYRADKLLPILAASTHGRRVIGLTSVDVSTTKGGVKDWGVLGLGSGPSRSCVVSIFRTGKGKVRKRVYRARLVNVCVHELGHAYGLGHCAVAGCVMADAKGRIRTFDDSPGEFCGACRAKLGERLR